MENFFKEKLERFITKNVVVVYSGPSLSTGQIGPVEVSGTLVSLNKQYCTIETKDGTIEKLELREIDPHSIKKNSI